MRRLDNKIIVDNIVRGECDLGEGGMKEEGGWVVVTQWARLTCQLNEIGTMV